MADFIVMPKLGFDMREGVLVNWLKEPGESITKGEVVAEIESDKATLELEAQVGGTLLQFLAAEGDVVPIGGNLAIVGDEGEDVSQLLEEAPVSEKERPQAAADESEPVVSADQPQIPDETIAGDMTYPGGAKATPVARRLAQQEGVELAKINGSGPGGRIRKADVEAYLAGAVKAKEAELPVAGSGDVEVPTSRLRQVIGRRMTESKTTVPHFYVTTEIDMGKALDLRQEINALIPDEQKVTVNDLIVKAAALALQNYPNLNASFGGDSVIQHQAINIGSAVAVEGGLLTVVQKNTNSSTLAQIAVENRAMVSRAREGKSLPDDFDGVTFTVSNLGAFDVDHFIAIINPPNAAILAVGSAQQVPVVTDGQLAIGWRMKATLSADHRVTDGAEAARYLQHLKGLLEEPLRLLL